MLLVSKRNRLVRFLTHLAPSLVQRGATVKVVEGPHLLADTPFDRQLVLILDIPADTTREAQDDFLTEVSIWLDVNPGTAAVAVIPPELSELKRKLGRRARVVSDAEAFDEEFWETLYAQRRTAVAERALLDDIKGRIGHLGEAPRWPLRATLALRVMELAKKENSAEEIALKLVQVSARSVDRKNAARQKLFQQLKTVGLPTCKVLGSLTRLAWVWKLRAQGLSFNDIARDLNCAPSAKLRLALRKQANIRFADVDRIPYPAVLEAVACALTQLAPPKTVQEVIEPLLTKYPPPRNDREASKYQETTEQVPNMR